MSKPIVFLAVAIPTLSGCASWRDKPANNSTSVSDDGDLLHQTIFGLSHYSENNWNFKN